MHPSAQRQKLQILVRADVELAVVVIAVKGCITALNIHGLDMVIRRAGALSAGTEIIVDLSDTSQGQVMGEELEEDGIQARVSIEAPAFSLQHRLRVVAPRMPPTTFIRRPPTRVPELAHHR